ncbi:putative endonuclease LCL3 [Madurella mycetomatis]|uniref:Probable endonuclease LCL3 n=1 Tax=Madurella mycetomatis TaxID=100816 RepID=A0A175W3L7_9PEZI|nr:putative endonuclease LCL3 [Madurella mycetomatis]
MPWGRSSSSTPDGGKDDDEDSRRWASRSSVQRAVNDRPRAPPPPAATRNESSPSTGSALVDSIREHLRQPHNWIAPIAAAGLTLGLWTFYHAYLRRFPGSHHIAPSFFRRRSLLGKVTSVGDGDGFHMFHTPGGRLAGWGWLRSVPKDRKELKGRTISVRIAGVDAPEGAHFGKPAQPFAAEALAWLEGYVLNKRVRAFIYRRDQYERVVATVYVRKPPFFLRKDVGLELLKCGLATTYEGKTGAEFGGSEMEETYKAAEAAAKKKGKGMWSTQRAALFGSRKTREIETPMAFKRRMKLNDSK